MKTVLLGVSSSISAYKAVDIANQIAKKGIAVDTILTSNAAKLVTPLTFQALTKRKAYVEMFDDSFYPDVRHISLAKSADAALLAPATANVIGKIASGIADDMLTTVFMAIPKGIPVLICPAMNTNMYENSIVQENMEKLKRHGYIFVEPRVGRLACDDVGLGALASVSDILASVYRALGISEA
ncbi:MAG: phosphopantothenoylcysteine decarboxylase [Eubacteriaceae bacterium]|jgi:phosphopantothenoylcysteine decarboxylase/phosphopantothenoylcysteine decarboxylase/phosphopantothenate--cysteine ligase|nr:phosphopantothenoylcysteine decarboxylase [Eubacteriaceae bacterium]